MEQELQIIQGAVSAVVYQNYENGYAVTEIKCSDGILDLITMKEKEE